MEGDLSKLRPQVKRFAVSGIDRLIGIHWCYLNRTTNYYLDNPDCIMHIYMYMENAMLVFIRIKCFVASIFKMNSFSVVVHIL